jgi:hypothetical protein
MWQSGLLLLGSPLLDSGGMSLLRFVYRKVSLSSNRNEQPEPRSALDDKE